MKFINLGRIRVRADAVIAIEPEGSLSPHRGSSVLLSTGDWVKSELIAVDVARLIEEALRD